MSASARLDPSRGPFVASNVHDGSRYELSRGHAIYCAPAGGARSAGIARAMEILSTDRMVKYVGGNAGFSPEPGTLRAPDVAPLPDERAGWLPGAPPLAVEFAGQGQDEEDLQIKIRELLDAGTQQIWVVRQLGPPRVEVHTPDEPLRLAFPGQELTAPGVLELPVPVKAFFDQEAVHAVALRNLLRRLGFESLEDVGARSRVEGRVEGRVEAILLFLEARGLPAPDALRARVLACRDEAQLAAWTTRAARAEQIHDVFPDEEEL